MVIINSMGERVVGPTRVNVRQPERLLTLLAPYRPVDAMTRELGYAHLTVNAL